MRQLADRIATKKSPLFVASILLAAVAGCDKIEDAAARADRKANAAVDQAVQRLDISGESARTAIAEVANDQDVEGAARVRVKATLADADLKTARDKLDAVSRRQIRLNAVAWQIGQLTDNLATTASLLEMYKELEPTVGKEQAATARRSAQGSGADSAWFKHDGADLPTLSAATQEISRLEGEINRRQQSIDELSRKRNDLLQQADQATSHSNELTGDAAVAEFQRGSDLRTQAGGVDAEIQQLEYELSPLRADLSVTQKQAKSLERAINNFDSADKNLDASWQVVTTEINSQRQLAQLLLSGSGVDGSAENTGKSIAAYAAELNELLQQNDDERREAEALLGSVISSYGDAATAAENLRRSTNEQAQATPAAKEALDSLSNAYNPSVYRLQQATTKYLLANSRAAAVQELNTKQELISKLQPVAQRVSLTLPAELSDIELSARLQLAREAAEEAFADAEASLAGVLSGGMASPSTRNNARITRIITLYGWSQFQSASGNAQGAADHYEQAKQETVQVVTENIALPPSFPTDLRLAAAGAAPAAQPTNGTPEPAAQ